MKLFPLYSSFRDKSKLIWGEWSSGPVGVTQVNKYYKYYTFEPVTSLSASPTVLNFSTHLHLFPGRCGSELIVQCNTRDKRDEDCFALHTSWSQEWQLLIKFLSIHITSPICSCFISITVWCVSTLYQQFTLETLAAVLLCVTNEECCCQWSVWVSLTQIDGKRPCQCMLHWFPFITSRL